MKIGMIIHSMTGNTSHVAERIKNRLEDDGHQVSLEKLFIVVGEDLKEDKIENIEFEPLSIDISQVDMLIIGCPVRGFSASPPIKAFLAKTEDLRQKDIMVFVTHAFPYSWMGGKTAIKQLRKIFGEMGTSVVHCGIIDWKNARREQQIEDLVDSMARKISL